jgi:hypothetical protein
MSDKASKKNKKAAGKKDQIDEETLSKLLDAKLKEFGISGDDDKDLKKIKKKYNALSKVTVQSFCEGEDDAIKLNKLVEAYNELLEYNTFFEENGFVVDRLRNTARQERDLYQGDLTKLVNIKSNFEKFARDVQKNNSQIKDINVKFVEEETKKREDILASFETTINEITIKLDEEKLGAATQTAENEKLKAEFEAEIGKYETREKEFFDSIKDLDTKNDSRTKGVLGNLKDIEERAKKAFEIKDEIQSLKRKAGEDKLKIAVYSQRFGDLENTFNSTIDVLQKFRGELEKSASRVKGLHQENKELKAKTEKVQDLTLQLFNLNQDLKKKLEDNNKKKNTLREKCITIQNDLKAKTEQLTQLEQSKTATA